MIDKKRYLVLHPFLFAIYPILSLYSHNIVDTSLDETYIPTAISVSCCLVILALLTMISKDIHKSGLLASLTVLLFFSYGLVYDAIQGTSIGSLEIGRHRFLLLAYATCLLTGVVVVVRIQSRQRNVTSLLNIIAASLIVVTILGILKSGFSATPYASDRESGVPGDWTDSRPSPGHRPDIYYIILDGYAGSTILENMFGHDNQSFLDSLRDRGFLVQSHGRSNYAATSLSLASSLNMEYINYLSDQVPANSDDRTIPIEMIQRNQAMLFLKSRGYESIHFDSGWGTTRNNIYADLTIQCGQWSEFQIVLINTTLLNVFSKYYIGEPLRERILCMFSELAEIQHKTHAPRFVFAHIVAPHPPYVFGRNGEPIAESELKMNEAVYWKDRGAYIDQLVFINDKIEALLDTLLSESTEPPIIIVQGDHGSSCTGGRRTEPTDMLVRERMSILNAYYLPNQSNPSRYESITPVNTFRLILNDYLGADFSLLEDVSYYSRADRLYNFTDVTHLLTED